jgi:hypothetical protein
MSINWSTQTKIDAHTGLFNGLATGPNPPKFDVYAGGTLLVSLVLAGTGAAAGSVSGTTGVITLLPGAPQVGLASGIAATANLVRADGTVAATALPCVQGTAPVSGSVVLSTLNIIAGGNVQLLFAEIGV